MENLDQATRQIMWNIEPAWLMYVLFAVALGFFGYGVYKRVQFWRGGKADGERVSDWGKRFGIVVKELLLQKRVRGSRFPGFFHSALFYAFLVLIVVTGVVAIDYDIGTTLFNGYLYVVLTVAAEIAGLFVLIGIGMATYRRVAIKPESMPNGRWKDTLPLLLLGFIILTGFITEGIRMAVAGDQWAALAPIGYVFSLPFQGISEDGGRLAHAIVWWAHLAGAFGWIAMIPFTKFAHLISLPMNVFFSKLQPRGALKRVDILALMETDEFYEEGFDMGMGVGKAGDFTWKQRLDFEACIECGRCEEICPATRAGHPFSPREFVKVCKDLVHNANGADGDAANPEIIGNAIDEEFIWYCRTCSACTEVCPAAIDHVDTIMEVRRTELLMNGRAPSDATRALKMLENRGNPFAPQTERVDWISELGIPVVGPGEKVDVLFWIGCCVSFDPTKQKIAKDFCQLMQRCGIDFGVLGKDERCCGDPARVLGEERLFQEIATAQVEEIQKRDFRVMLTTCPHCYNVLKNEYPQFGATFDVLHHSEFLHEMVWSEELTPTLGVARKIVYQDPCYLGRYQKQYDAPRQALKALPGTTIVEMKDNMEQSLCCGGGGGHYWMDLHSTERINNLRVEQAQKKGADTIVTACPYCAQMLDDSIKQLDLEDDMRVADIGSLILASLPPQEACCGCDCHADDDKPSEDEAVS